MTKLYVALTSSFSALRARLVREEGASAVEYGLLVALIAAVIIAAVTALGLAIAGVFNTTAGAVGGAVGS